MARATTVSPIMGNLGISKTSNDLREDDTQAGTVNSSAEVRPDAARILDDALIVAQYRQNRQTKASRLALNIQKHIRESAEEIFQDGMESSLSRSIEEMVSRHGNDAIKAIDHIIERGCDTEAAAEMLTTLGHIDDRTTQAARLTLLVKNLQSLNDSIRAMASDGLMYLGDPRALAPLRTAVRQEGHADIKKDMELAIEELSSLL